MPKKKSPLPKKEESKKPVKPNTPADQGKDFHLPETDISDIVDDAIKDTEQELASNKQTSAE